MPRHGGWTAAAVALALNGMPILLAYRPGHFADGGPKALVFEQSGGPPALDVEQQAELKVAVQGSPEQGGIDLSNWNCKVVRRFVEERFGLGLSRSSCGSIPVGGRIVR